MWIWLGFHWIWWFCEWLNIRVWKWRLYFSNIFPNFPQRRQLFYSWGSLRCNNVYPWNWFWFECGFGGIFIGFGWIWVNRCTLLINFPSFLFRTQLYSVLCSVAFILIYGSVIGCVTFTNMICLYSPRSVDIFAKVSWWFIRS